MRIELNACCLGLQAHQTPHMCHRGNQGKPDGTGWKLEEVSAKAFPGYIITQDEYNIL